MPLITGAAETDAVTAATNFLTEYPAAKVNVTSNSGTGWFTMRIVARSGANYFQYTVTETTARVQVDYIEDNNGTHLLVAAFEELTRKNGGLVNVEFSQRIPTSVQTVSEVNDVVTNANPAPPSDLPDLAGNLLANLQGPALQVLIQFYVDLAQLFWQ
jgi:NADPH:quinone reductase-like Zn-dependent oxidoreductase